jgi:hypothetical protein
MSSFVHTAATNSKVPSPTWPLSVRDTKARSWDLPEGAQVSQQVI